MEGEPLSFQTGLISDLKLQVVTCFGFMYTPCCALHRVETSYKFDSCCPLSAPARTPSACTGPRSARGRIWCRRDRKAGPADREV